MVFVFNIVLRAFARIAEYIMGLHDNVETRTIAGVLVVRMVTLGKVAKHPLYRFRVGVRTDFQDFVVVDEVRGFHHMLPSGPSHGQCVTRPLKAFLSFRGLARGTPARNLTMMGTIFTG